MNPNLLAAVTPAAHAAAPAAHASAAPLIRMTTVPNANPPVQTITQTTPPPPQTWMQMHAPWATHTLAALFIISAISLIVLLAMQTTKQEGLSGSIGGRVESAYRGRMGAEEQLKRVTGIAAGALVITALILSLTGI